MKTICLANQKGGCSKSTTAQALAFGLYHEGKKVLTVDADPQGNLSFAAGVPEADHTLYEVLKDGCKIADTINHIKDGLDLISIGLEATACDMELSSQVAREYLIKKALKPLEKKYDYCVIDTPPTLSLLTLNALTAADSLLIPLNLDVYSLQGIAQLQGFIENIREYTNPGLEIAGLLVTKYNARLNLSQVLIENFEKAAESLQTKVFETRIREATAIKEAQLLQQDFFEDAKSCKATQDYKAFVDEFLKTEG